MPARKETIGFIFYMFPPNFMFLPWPTTKAQGTQDLPVWRDCSLQTYFTAKGLIDYFVVLEAGQLITVSQALEKVSIPLRLPSIRHTLMTSEKTLFEALEKDQESPGWFGPAFRPIFRELRDEEIRSSYALPPKRVPDGVSHTAAAAAALKYKGSDLFRILIAAEAMLRDAYTLCSDMSLGRKMTQQRASLFS
ncbi:hypothetical protein RJ55_08677 [Drechmeria coniospora]|nr:hypothetical protein RJ55_08677 [Drechmeria coniospora]